MTTAAQAIRMPAQMKACRYVDGNALLTRAPAHTEPIGWAMDQTNEPRPMNSPMRRTGMSSDRIGMVSAVGQALPRPTTIMAGMSAVTEGACDPTRAPTENNANPTINTGFLPMRSASNPAGTAPRAVHNTMMMTRKNAWSLGTCSALVANSV